MSLIEHKKARLNYEVLEEYEAGLELLGPEVKAIRNKLGKLEGAHITVRGGEAYLIGASIPPYQSNNMPEGYEAERNRKLLLTKKEITTLAAHEAQKGLALVPLRIFAKGKNLKLLVAVARGKKKFDKRATLKARDTKRDIDRTLKRGE